MKHPNSKGITLVELLVVIAITGIMIGMTFPALQPDREKARRLQCANQLRLLAIAAHSYHDCQNRFPSSCNMVFIEENNDYIRIPDGYSWLVELLPFMEEAALYYQFEAKRGSPNEAIKDDKVRKGISRRLAMFLCPSSNHEPSGLMDSDNADKQGITNYVVLSATHAESLNLSVERGSRGCNYDQSAMRPDGAVFPGSKTTLEAINDGVSNTIFITETADEFRRWAVGADASVVALPTRGSGAKKTVAFINRGEGYAFKFAALEGWTLGNYNEETTVRRENRLSYMNWDYGDQEFNGPNGYVDVVSEKAVGPVTKAPAEAYKPVRRSPSSYLGWGATNRNHIRKGVSSYHKGIVIHALCDASILNISVNVDPQIYMFMTTANGGDPAQRPE